MGRNWAATLHVLKHIRFLRSHEKIKLRVNTTCRPYTYTYTGLVNLENIVPETFFLVLLPGWLN